MIWSMTVIHVLTQINVVPHLTVFLNVGNN